MSIRRTLMTVGAVAALAAIPASATAKATGQGRFCQGESKTHIAGAKATPYSVCVAGADRLIKAQGRTKGKSQAIKPAGTTNTKPKTNTKAHGQGPAHRADH